MEDMASAGAEVADMASRAVQPSVKSRSSICFSSVTLWCMGLINLRSGSWSCSVSWSKIEQFWCSVRRQHRRERCRLSIPSRSQPPRSRPRSASGGSYALAKIASFHHRRRNPRFQSTQSLTSSATYRSAADRNSNQSAPTGVVRPHSRQPTTRSAASTSRQSPTLAVQSRRRRSRLFDACVGASTVEANLR